MVALPPEKQPAQSTPPPSPPGRLHGFAIMGMAISALVGITTMLAFITVNWPNPYRGYVIVVFVTSGIVFTACASTAMFAAARDTYSRRSPEQSD